MAFKSIRGLRMPYRRQGRIYFTLVNYDEMPETAKKRIDRLISDAAGGDRAYTEALRAWLLHDDADVRRVSAEHYVSISTLCRMREKVYRAW